MWQHTVGLSIVRSTQTPLQTEEFPCLNTAVAHAQGGALYLGSILLVSCTSTTDSFLGCGEWGIAAALLAVNSSVGPWNLSSLSYIMQNGVCLSGEGAHLEAKTCESHL